MNYIIILALDEKEYSKYTLPILGEPMIYYPLRTFASLPAYKVICIPENKKEFFFNKLEEDVKYVEKNNFITEISSMIEFSPGYTIILPVAMPLIDDILMKNLIQKHLKKKNSITLAVSSAKDIKVSNLFQNLLCVNNCFLFSLLQKLKDNPPTNLNKILKKEKIGYLNVKNKSLLLHLSNSNSYEKAEQIIRQTILKKHSTNGVLLENAQTIAIGPKVRIEPGVTIRQGSLLLGDTYIGENALIGPNTELRNACIKETAKVMQSVVVDSFVGVGAIVGPFAHLRLNTRVGSYDRIGNFVEIKNSTLGCKTNVSHLTYIGDTICGSGVNFGCGVVTVNYDGRKKHQTIIGDNVFIGCNSNLIAPITIGDDSFIAAGSTINEDIKKGAFAIARARQIIKEDYACRFGYKKIEN